ncbi:MAG: ATP-binding protein [Xanthomonadaceae bacterium]|nr:ATP-binding protein [Xanthomonadaceae bacterium]
MPHDRKRHALSLIIKKLKFSRIVSLQGARQTGKSFIAREIIQPQIKNSQYITLDSTQDRSLANRNPSTFLSQFEDSSPVIIDEAQKAGDLFDEIKLRVDLNPKPGQYLLLGSTEFSHELKIMESLTGRLSRVELFPLNLAEALSLEPNPSHTPSLLNRKPRVTRNQLLKHLSHGGLPGIFSVRDPQEREQLLTSWLKLVSDRDLLQIKTLKLDSDLATDMIRALPTLEEPDVASLAKKLRVASRKIATHLKALELLFVIKKILPHSAGSGKPRYFLIDLGISKLLGQSLRSAVQQCLLLEQWSQRSYHAEHSKLCYYRSSRGNIIDLIIEDSSGKHPPIAIQVSDSEKIDLRDFQILHAFKKKVGKAQLIHLAPVSRHQTLDGVEVFPWESMA